jgi:hypothetical protein
VERAAIAYVETRRDDGDDDDVIVIDDLAQLTALGHLIREGNLSMEFWRCTLADFTAAVRFHMGL